MKVLFLTNIPSPYRVDFFNALGKLCDLTVLYELGYASDRNKKWKYDKARNFKEIFLKGKRVGADSAICFSVLKYLKDNNYDVIVIGGYSTPTGMLSILYLNMIKREFILNCDGGFPKKDNKLKYFIKKYFISSAKLWLSTGKETNKYLINYGADKNNIRIYPFTSINEKDLSSEKIDNCEKIKIKDNLGITEKKVVISVGQFIHRKGYDILLKACENLDKNIGVYIIGANTKDECIKLKEKYKMENIHFLEFKSKNELKKYYKVADLFVLPTREDIWGLVINEAMAYAIPVVTTKKCIAGIELLSYEYSVLVESENYIDLRKIMNEILSNEDLSNKISSENKKIIKNYTIERMADVHYKIFKEIKQ
ncbi:MAG: glycosyltransferase family 4 protein [Clostridium perfringens]|uniref:glycosyltransferase family 4 protein n=1 Tax=Clostridium perfringens TaxID=1502 RepID=UPI0018D73869|nr:glycosyltransferase family 4 protein [Clostridium perfringens]MCR1963322.1 glycosyltransferase family 4 protein [Clostridium perfringens]MDU3194802.1 glycosyltransferase family 4 protein [Clostridium perfringens]QPR52155.1 glycosyltransferase family 4 protein [Clostridium perfringens]